MTFDLIITTYNRPDNLLQLVLQAFECNLQPQNIIVVDSSETINSIIEGMADVVYIRSSHKNQPYQRLLGAYAASSEIVVFLDDDLEIININLFDLLISTYNDESTVGATVGIDYHSSITEEMDNPILSINKKGVNWFWKFTGVVFPPSGKMGRLGMVGSVPLVMQNVEFFRGPCMSFKRIVAQSIISLELLSQTERKLNMGEDKAISLLATRYGNLIYVPDQCLYHPPNSSTYFSNTRSFVTKSIYSRLYLSKVYASVFNKPLWIEYLIFIWFVIWRIIIALSSLLLNFSKSRKEKLFGIFDGFWLSLTLPQTVRHLTPDISWEIEIQNDIQRAFNNS